jgi:hypothetical protein
LGRSCQKKVEKIFRSFSAAVPQLFRSFSAACQGQLIHG